MRIEYCGICDKGALREVNQDAVLMEAEEDMALFAVADGMGGHKCGEAASGILVTQLQRWWEFCWRNLLRNGKAESFDERMTSLREQVTYANKVIHEQYNRGTDICGSTIVILLIQGNCYYVLSSGDSRLYSLKGMCWEQMTVDDVWENQPDIIASYLPWQRKEHAYYGKLVRAVGVSEKAGFYERTGTLESGVRFLLCSDGLYKTCTEKELKNILRRYRGKRNEEKLLNRMIHKVYENGARDNASAILVRCID
ncbi:MAG: serine/threonine-protein phosphatase [Eubacterium sp.]|nr:serine/threonine-protein phosphatase [Eubacterium sp.]